MSKPKKNGDARPRFKLPEPEGTIKAPPAKQPEPTGADADTLRRVRELLDSPLRIFTHRAVVMMYSDLEDMRAGRSPKEGPAEQSAPNLDAHHQELLALGLEGPKRSFLLDAITLAGTAAIMSRRHS